MNKILSGEDDAETGESYESGVWYRRPATRWFEALPIGNGRIGGMVYGGVATSRIDITESTCYSGATHPNPWPTAAQAAFREAREALLNRDYRRGESAVVGMLGDMHNYGTHLPLGRLLITSVCGEIRRYRRSLDFDTATARVNYGSNGAGISHTFFVSQPAQLMVVRLTSSVAGGLDLSLTADGGRNPHSVTTDERDLILSGSAREALHSDNRSGVDFVLRTRILERDGRLSAGTDEITVSGAREVLILIAVHTTFGRTHPETVTRHTLGNATAKSFEELEGEHIADYRRLYRKTRLRLGPVNMSSTPTDERIKRFRKGFADPGLEALMFQFGRYSLITSSRADSPLPAHLQGIWNDDEACRIGWTCDMHLDINTQMNYWPAEVTGLSECVEPLFRWLERILVPSGRRTAASSYGLPGWVAHTISNPWGYSAPGRAAYWGLHVTGGAWISLHLWEHYLFSGDLTFLRDRAYPILREAAEFFLAYLVEDPVSGYLVSGPSCSPENDFVSRDGTFTNGMGTVCDSVIIRRLFSACIESAKLLGTDTAWAAGVTSAMDRLPPLRAGTHGQLMEWLEDLEEATPNHRHTSHLLALFPFCEIDPLRTPRSAEAARITIARRYTSEAGWEDTGWARNNLILYSARLHDGTQAEHHLRKLIGSLTEDNLMVFHPPGAGAVNNVYEMDGNTGCTAGIVEMLLQSHGDALHLLPAVPPSWKTGRVAGLCARGGYEVALDWDDGGLVRAEIGSATGRVVCRVRYRDVVREIRGEGVVHLNGNLERV